MKLEEQVEKQEQEIEKLKKTISLLLTQVKHLQGRVVRGHQLTQQIKSNVDVLIRKNG